MADASQGVLSQLYSGNPKDRVWALRELGATGQNAPYDAAGRVYESFHDMDPSVQEAAVAAMGELGQYALPYVNEIVSMLLNTDKEVRQAAVRALGFVGDEYLADKVEPFLDDQDLDLVTEACTALGNMGAKTSSAKLEKKLKDKDSAVVAAASGSLCSLGAGAAAVTQALKGDVRAKAAVLGGLQKRGGELSDEFAKPIAALVGDSDSQVRIGAAIVIRQLGPKAAKEASAIGKLLSSTDSGARACAAVALAGIGEGANSEAGRLKDLLSDESEDKSTLMLSIAGVQPKVDAIFRKPACAAAAALAQIGAKGRELAPAVAKGMESKDFEIRIASLQAVAAMGGEGANFMDDAMKLIEDPMPVVTAQACLALGRMAESAGATSAAAEKLADCLKDKLPIVRAAACQGLAKMGEEATNFLDVLIKCLNDQAAAVRAAACEPIVACGELGQMYAADVCRLIYDSEAFVRVTAVESLVQMGERGAAFSEEIGELYADPAPEVRKACETALMKFDSSVPLALQG